jgi:hypothetical protein
MNFTKRLLFEIRIAIDRDCYPSLAELAAWLDWPYSTTHHRLGQLERGGAVEVYNRGGNGNQLVILPTAKNEPTEGA